MNSLFRNASRNNNSFTLIELLVVLALVAILSVVVVMTLNPAELIKQARDSNRLSDLSTINTALNLFSADVTSGFMGTSTVVYVSLPDSSPTCANLGLPVIPTSTYTYNCVTAATLRNTNGTGWIPVNFQRISSNSPISQLPVDPQNTTSTKYYTYVTGGSWKVIASPESVKYTATAGTDGGSNIGQFEVGNNMSLAPFTDGLVGWWKFDEGSGLSTTADSSGYGNSGTWNGTSTSHYIGGKVGQYAGYFNGSSDYVRISNRIFPINSPWSFTMWQKINPAVYNWAGFIGGLIGADGGYWFYHDGTLRWYQDFYNSVATMYYPSNAILGTQIPYDIWTQVSVVSEPIDANNTRVTVCVDGCRYTSVGIFTWSARPGHNFTFSLIGNGDNATRYFNGSLDDVRVYSRVLSAAEILALYNATK